MSKKIIAIVVILIFIFSLEGIRASQSYGATSEVTAKPMEKTKDRLSRGMNNLLYGPTEVPDNLNKTASKGSKIDRCSVKTRSGVERGIARFVGGIWQVATFWYSDPDCATSSKRTSSTTTK